MAAEELESADERRKALKGIKKRITALSKELALHKVTPFDPLDQTTLGYLGAIIMNVNWPQSFATVQRLHSQWEEKRSSPLDMLQRIEDAVHNEGVPEELLVDDPTPLLGLKTNVHVEYLKNAGKDELQMEINNSA